MEAVAGIGVCQGGERLREATRITEVQREKRELRNGRDVWRRGVQRGEGFQGGSGPTGPPWGQELRGAVFSMRGELREGPQSGGLPEGQGTHPS